MLLDGSSLNAPWLNAFATVNECGLGVDAVDDMEDPSQDIAWGEYKDL